MTNSPNEIDAVIKAFSGDYGWTVRLSMIRAQFVLYVPLVNSWLQTKMTEAVVYSPVIATNIVTNKTYKAVAFIVYFCTGIKLPNEGSMKKFEADTGVPTLTQTTPTDKV